MALACHSPCFSTGPDKPPYGRGRVRQQHPLKNPRLPGGWLGRPGATDEQIRTAESRLGTALPSSYRSFLRFSNGWQSFGRFVTNPGPLWSTDEVDWFRVRNQSWIDAWTEGYLSSMSAQDEVPELPEHLAMPYLLEVSAAGDSAILLLNPLVMAADGEWEAWDFASWYPGAIRYRSFWELMNARFERFHCGEAQQTHAAPGH